MYDVLLLILNQKTPTPFNISGLTILPLNPKGEDKPKYYAEIWPFINNSDGILYKVFAEGAFSEFECGDGLFCFDYDSPKGRDVPDFLYNSNPYLKEDLVRFSLIEQHQDSFYRLTKEMVYASPTKTAIFLCRGQSGENEVIIGTINLDVFNYKINRGSIYTNVCYIISGTK